MNTWLWAFSRRVLTWSGRWSGLSVASLMCVARMAAKAAPREMVDLRRSFGESTLEGPLLWAVVALPAVALVALLLWGFVQGRRGTVERIANDPEALFEDALGQLELTAEQQRLLRLLARGARLRHPTMCLLSPDLMEWSVDLWRSEKGEHGVKQSQVDELREIALGLFGCAEDVVGGAGPLVESGPKSVVGTRRRVPQGQ